MPYTFQLARRDLAIEGYKQQLDALASGNGEHLSDATVLRGRPHAGGETAPRLFGMCGRLATWRG